MLLLVYDSGIQLVFLRKVIRQKRTDVMSFSTQFEKIECGLLLEAFQSEGECFSISLYH